MKLIWVIIFFVLIQSSSSFGNPNGKGVICKCENCIMGKEYTEGFLFLDNLIYTHKISRNKNSDKFKIKKSKGIPFTLNETHILWKSYSLNRKTLIIKNFSRLISKNNEYVEGTEKYNCLLSSNKKFDTYMENLKLKQQKEYNLKRKGNKL